MKKLIALALIAGITCSTSFAQDTKAEKKAAKAEKKAEQAKEKKVLKKDIIDNENDMKIYLRLFLNNLHNCNLCVIIDHSCSKNDD